MVNHGTGWVRLEWRIPARGLVGMRTEFMTETRGSGIMHSNFDGYAPWFGDIRLRQNGVLVADRRGDTTGNALLDLEQRGVLFVGPGVEVYEGMIVGENARSDEMNVNPRRKRSSPTCAPRAATTRADRAAHHLLARTGPRIHRRRRGRRGHAPIGSSAQGRSRRRGAPPPP